MSIRGSIYGPLFRPLIENDMERRRAGERLDYFERRRLRRAMGANPIDHIVTTNGRARAFALDTGRMIEDTPWYLRPLAGKYLGDATEQMTGKRVRFAPLRRWDRGLVSVGRHTHPSVYAHELGHIQQFDEGAWEWSQRHGRKLSEWTNKASIGAGVAAGALGARMGLRSSALAAPAVAVGLNAPRMSYELDASRRALKGMREVGYDDETMRESKKLSGLAFGSYTIPAVEGAIAGTGAYAGGALVMGRNPLTLKRLGILDKLKEPAGAVGRAGARILTRR